MIMSQDLIYKHGHHGSTIWSQISRTSLSLAGYEELNISQQEWPGPHHGLTDALWSVLVRLGEFWKSRFFHSSVMFLIDCIIILWMGQRNPENHQKDGWKPINNGMFTTVFNWWFGWIATIHRIIMYPHSLLSNPSAFGLHINLHKKLHLRHKSFLQIFLFVMPKWWLAHKPHGPISQSHAGESWMISQLAPWKSQMFNDFHFAKLNTFPHLHPFTAFLAQEPITSNHHGLPSSIGESRWRELDIWDDMGQWIASTLQDASTLSSWSSASFSELRPIWDGSVMVKPLPFCPKYLDSIPLKNTWFF